MPSSARRDAASMPMFTTTMWRKRRKDSALARAKPRRERASAPWLCTAAMLATPSSTRLVVAARLAWLAERTQPASGAVNRNAAGMVAAASQTSSGITSP